MRTLARRTHEPHISSLEQLFQLHRIPSVRAIDGCFFPLSACVASDRLLCEGDMKKSFLLRLDMADYDKIADISDRYEVSMRQVILTALEEFMKKVKEAEEGE